MAMRVELCSEVIIQSYAQLNADTNADFKLTDPRNIHLRICAFLFLLVGIAAANHDLDRTKDLTRQVACVVARPPRGSDDTETSCPPDTCRPFDKVQASPGYRTLLKWLDSRSAWRFGARCTSPTCHLNDASDVDADNLLRNSVQSGHYARNIPEPTPSTSAQNHGWTTLQILVPVIVGIGIFSLCLSIFILYRRRLRARYGPVSAVDRTNSSRVLMNKNEQTSTPPSSLRRAWTHAKLQQPRKFGIFPNVKAVHSRDRLSEWSIDLDDVERDGEANGTNHSRRLSSSSLIASMPVVRPAHDSVSLPEDPLPQIQNASASVKLGKPLRGVVKDREGRKPMAHVVSAPPRRGFNIYDSDSNSPTTMNTSRQSVDSRARQLGALAFSSPTRGVESPENENIENRDVLLISREGEDFSIITSPTTETGHTLASGSSRLAFPFPPPPSAHLFTPAKGPNMQLPDPSFPAMTSANPFSRPLPGVPPPHLAQNQLHDNSNPATGAIRPAPASVDALPGPDVPTSSNSLVGHDRESMMLSAAPSSENEYTVPNPFVYGFSVENTRIRDPPQLHDMSSKISIE
ncbi:hypothetical protein BD410DRAFT_898979 [Rickenella mellea]|uniref:Transmembrane protein n=1 Tax=Rickenella mellea TaxID=50990 RepID=A0A4Y7Q1A1_9AGAM|nr:hypothetical protein BD410DRAFT_898979 [Rickenella mellea]